MIENENNKKIQREILDYLQIIKTWSRTFVFYL